MQIHSVFMCFRPVAVLTAKIRNYQEHLLKHHKVSQRVWHQLQKMSLDKLFSGGVACEASMTSHFIWQRTSRTFMYGPSADLILFFSSSFLLSKAWSVMQDFLCIHPTWNKNMCHRYSHGWKFPCCNTLKNKSISRKKSFAAIKISTTKVCCIKLLHYVLYVTA